MDPETDPPAPLAGWRRVPDDPELEDLARRLTRLEERAGRLEDLSQRVARLEAAAGRDLRRT